MEINFRKLSALAVLTPSLLTLSSTSEARYQEPVPVYENHLSLGPTVTYSSSTYDGVKSDYTTLPTFSFRLGNLFGHNYHDEPLLGFELFQHKRIMFGLAATSGRTELDLEKVEVDREFLYWGIEENRDRAIEAGFIFRYFSRIGLLEIKTFRDVIDTYNGIRSSISWSRPFPGTGNWLITPRVFAKHYSAKHNTYYYGITGSEQEEARQLIESGNAGTVDGKPISADDYEKTDVRPTYAPGNSGHVGFDIKFEYSFTDNFKGTGYLMIEKFSGEIETSPLVEEKQQILGSIGFIYDF